MDTTTATGWRRHFGNDAADVIAIVCHFGGYDLKDVLMRCFKRSRNSQRISMPTVEAVLGQIRAESKLRNPELYEEPAVAE